MVLLGFGNLLTGSKLNLPDKFLGDDICLIGRKPLFHNKSGQLIYLEVDGRISAWSLKGELRWCFSLKESNLGKERYSVGESYFNIFDDLIFITRVALK